MVHESLRHRAAELLNAMTEAVKAAEERDRVELLKVRGWAATGRGDLTEMRKWFAECRRRLDRVTPQKQMWVGMLRAQLGMKEREMEEGKR
jgi:2-oxo-4-hydroxy-4-carboxy--5-ureidoimidazoline (OHCU) decarboxylase